jgi:hypothetical protein
MRKAAGGGPVCPGCGYPIFGLREMRCPECGRALDVRDFSIDNAENRGDAAKYERTTAIGGVVGIVVLLALLAGMLFVIQPFLRFRLVPILFPLIIIGLVITLIGVAGQTMRSVWTLLKGRRK